jgi:hypothetical protein
MPTWELLKAHPAIVDALCIFSLAKIDLQIGRAHV